MKVLISHRGNISGPSPANENKPEYILGGLLLYPSLHFEVDIWWKDGYYFLGHDQPSYKVNEDFLTNARIWCHAKNVAALERMSSNPFIHFFWHQNDDFTLTSKGFIWTFPDKELINNSICVMPELYKFSPLLNKCAGVCSDYILDYQ